MPDTRFVGDALGDFEGYTDAIAGCHKSIQLGNLMTDFPTVRSLNRNHRFISGGMDNRERCSRHPNWISDFSVEGHVFFIGGSHEVISFPFSKPPLQGSQVGEEEMRAGVMIYKNSHPSVVVSHDCPESVAVWLRSNLPNRTHPKGKSITRIGLEAMLERHQPKIWIFSHWQTRMDQVINGTRFVCLNALQTMDINLDEYR